MNYIDVKNVSKVFTTSRGDFKVLESVNLSIEEGEFVCLVGISGGGKTTLLRMMAGFETPSSGEIICGNAKVTKPLLKHAYVFQDFNQLLPWKTARQNIGYSLRRTSLSKREQNDKVDELLKLVNMEDSAGKYPHALSGGMKQRIAIARALATNPKVIFMDEPFSALDEPTRENLSRKLLEIWEGHTSLTIVFVTHNLQEAILLSNKIVVIGGKPGSIIAVEKNNVEGQRLPSDRGYAALWSSLRASME